MGYPDTAFSAVDFKLAISPSIALSGGIMATKDSARLLELQYEAERASLRSHETHMRHIYGLRWGGLVLSALCILIGAVMIFLGLQGSFTWAVEAPNSIGAKLTNASPGIVFATIGMIIGFVVVLQKPVNYRTGESRIGPSLEIAQARPRGKEIGITLGHRDG